MQKNTITAGLIILLALSVMGTALLSYYYVLSLRNLSQARNEIWAIQQRQTRVNGLLRETLVYSRTNADILPLLEEAGVRLPPSSSPTNAPSSDLKEGSDMP